MTTMNIRLDPFRARFRIRNRLTGGYLHKSLFEILEFDTRAEAVFYIQHLGLNRDIYVTEAVL